ncbi:MAG: sulfur carrier protein ThiS [Gloeobacteraceae cyanobacterium ES-bin-144]|nr:sulfur carrier protein ThiS [Verrucomicrobiales bacterium]
MSQPATITLNGAPHAIGGPVSLDKLLETLGLADKPVVVELDEQAVFPRNYGETLVAHGSRIEIITLAAGG